MLQVTATGIEKEVEEEEFYMSHRIILSRNVTGENVRFGGEAVMR
jgi:hypothetical protein